MNRVPASASAPPATPFIISYTPVATRTDGPLTIGYQFTTGASTFTITGVARWVYSGNSASHLVGLYTFGGTLLTSATVNTSGQTPGGFSTFSACASFQCQPSTTYVIASYEGVSGADDTWGDQTVTAPVTTGVATIIGGAYFAATPPTGSFNVDTTSHVFVPVNFQYTTP